MPDVLCSQCGHRNPGGANFCSSCGAAIEEQAEEHTITLPAVEDPATVDDDTAIAVDDLEPGTGMLVVKRGPGSGSRFLLENDVVTAGRHPDSHIFLDDITVSRRHAEIRRSEAGYRVHDVGSLNGTYLNRERIEDAGLDDGDELQIGRFKLLFLQAPPA
jgi:pSer/pThr/pTyr-binding forkhead associated (FHA) protein